MKRVFGKKKETGPAPSLSEAGGRVDERVTKIDEKVKSQKNENEVCAPLRTHIYLV